MWNNIIFKLSGKIKTAARAEALLKINNKPVIIQTIAIIGSINPVLNKAVKYAVAASLNCGAGPNWRKVFKPKNRSANP